MIRSILSDEIPLILPLVRQVQALHVQNHPDLFQHEQSDAALIVFFNERLAQNQTILVCERGGIVAGYALFMFVDRSANLFRLASRTGHLDQICVDQAFRRQGVGQALISAMKDRLAAEGIENWSVDFWSFNTASAALMQASGAKMTRHWAEGTIPE